jgi:hypothetical protein
VVAAMPIGFVAAVPAVPVSESPGHRLSSKSRLGRGQRYARGLPQVLERNKEIEFSIELLFSSIFIHLNKREP